MTFEKIRTLSSRALKNGCRALFRHALVGLGWSGGCCIPRYSSRLPEVCFVDTSCSCVALPARAFMEDAGDGSTCLTRANSPMAFILHSSSIQTLRGVAGSSRAGLSTSESLCAVASHFICSHHETIFLVHMSPVLSCRTPQVVFEVVLVVFLLGLLARAGVSFTGFIAVFNSLWHSSFENTMYSRREHLLKKMEMAVISYSSAQMLKESGVDFAAFRWHLRPHHVAEDFADLLALVQQAFRALSAAHACWLFRRVRALIVDGKWCIQTRVCNARFCNPVFCEDLKEGYFKGCCKRPAPGSWYCAHHALITHQGYTGPKVTNHRKVLLPSATYLSTYIVHKYFCALFSHLRTC
jgi:hypothetical protein